MKKLLLTATALCALATPACAGVVSFCGPKPQGKCNIDDLSQHYPEVESGADFIKILGVDLITSRPLTVFNFGFKEVQFSLAIRPGNALDFEIIADGHIKKEKPKSDAVFQYNVISDQPLSEIELLSPTGFNNEIFAVYSDVRVGDITPLPEISTRSAIATPEPSTWTMGLIGFGALGYRRSLKRSECKPIGGAP